jgi:predicted MFS family arabinose efflux permease
MIAAERKSTKLPLGALLALAMTGFICILTETLPAGLLPEMSEGLGVSLSLSGQMVTVYALGSLLAAIPLTIVTQSWRRRTVLLVTIIGFLIFNSITALSSHYWLTLVARFFAGVSAGLAWSLIAGYARRMVVPQLQGRALAVAMVGTPIALSLGVPIGTWLGGVMGWRMAFGAMSVLTLVLIVWVLIKVPDYPGQPSSQRSGLRRVILTPGVRSVLGVVFTWMLAHNILLCLTLCFQSRFDPSGRSGSARLWRGGTGRYLADGAAG